MDVTVRLYADLADLAGGRDHAVPANGGRSVKDLIESLGVPHTELALVLVDDEAVAPDRLVTGGERVAAYPWFGVLAPDPDVAFGPRPPRPVRFVADVHLGTLARRLRTLGFDTWWDRDADDPDLAARARDEERVLLTRDRGLLMRRSVAFGHLPRSDDPGDQLREVIARFDLAPDIAPLTRCIRCNGRLVHVDKADVLEELPPRTRVEHDRFHRCDGCHRVYWGGSHLDGLNDIVEAALAGRPDVAPFDHR